MKFSMIKKLGAYISVGSILGGLLLMAAPTFAQVQIGEDSQINTTSGINSVSIVLPGDATTSVSSAEIATGNEGVLHTDASLVNDANVKGISTSSQSVSMSYPTHAKLFGFIPVVVTAKAEVQSNGVVHMQYPWYAIFMSTDEAALQAKLQAAANAILLTTGTTSASTNTNVVLTANNQVSLIHELHALLENNFSGSVQSTTTASSY